MRRALRLSPLLVGLALGVGAIVLAWTKQRAAVHGAPSAPAPLAPARYGAGWAGGGDLRILRARDLALPVAGVAPRDLRESFGDARSSGPHQAIDIPAARGTRVVAVADGVVMRVAWTPRGGLSVHQFDATSTYCFYYAHLSGYGPGVRQGVALHRGDTIGYVGTTGNAPPGAPHLHFAIFKLGPDQRWGEGSEIDPFLVWMPPG